MSEKTRTVVDVLKHIDNRIAKLTTDAAAPFVEAEDANEFTRNMAGQKRGEAAAKANELRNLRKWILS